MIVPSMGNRFLLKSTAVEGRSRAPILEKEAL